MQSETRRILRNMRRVRRFPANTCPASRHAALIAESLARSKYPDKENEGASIASTVASLWKLRTKLKDSGDAGG